MVQAVTRDGTISLRGTVMADHTRLLTAYDVAAITGMSYENALAMLKAHGIALGRRRRYITLAKLVGVLEGGGHDALRRDGGAAAGRD